MFICFWPCADQCLSMGISTKLGIWYLHVQRYPFHCILLVTRWITSRRKDRSTHHITLRSIHPLIPSSDIFISTGGFIPRRLLWTTRFFLGWICTLCGFSLSSSSPCFSEAIVRIGEVNQLCCFCFYGQPPHHLPGILEASDMGITIV